MAVVDSLEIQIQSKFDAVNVSLNELIKKMGLIAEGISAIGDNKGLDDFAKKAQEALKGLSSMQNAAKGLSGSIAPEVQKASKTLEEITAKYKDLGKGFKFTGSTAAIQKQIENYSNVLEKAKLKKEELEVAGKADRQMYEYAVKDALKYENVLASLKNQLAEMQTVQPQLDINIHGIEEAGQKIQEVAERIRTVSSISETAFNYNADAMAAVFGETARDIQNTAQAVEIFGKNAGQSLNDLPNPEIRLNGIEEAGNKLMDFGEKLNQLTVPEVREENLVKLQSSLSKTESKLDELRTKLENGLTMGRITESVDDSGFVRLQEQIAYTEKQAEALRGKISEVGERSINSTEIDQFGAALQKISGIGSKAKSIISGLASAAEKLDSGIKGAISKFLNLAKSITKIKSASKGMNISVSSLFKSLLKFASIRAIFNKLSSAAKEAFQNLAQYSPEVNASISSLKSSLDALKNSIGAAFAPILNAVAPALSAFIDMLTKAFNAVGRLFAALTGKSFASQAVKNYSDYAASVSGAGKATKEAGKDVQKGIRAFDELKTISINKDEGESGGAGGGEISPADMFADVPIESNVSDFAQKLKDAWAAADFTEIGAILGEKLNTALDSINWEPIKETVSRIGKSIATLLNGFVEVDGLGDTIGRTIAEALNTGLSGINAFLDNTHWDSVGQFIGNGLNGIVDAVDWEGIGHFFAAKWNAIFEVIGNFFETFDFDGAGSSLANSINTMFSDINWEYVGTSIINGLNSIISLIGSFIAETDWYSVATDLMNMLVSAIINIDWGNLGRAISDAAIGLIDMALAVIGETDWGALIQNVLSGIGEFIENIDWGEILAKLGAAIVELAAQIPGVLIGRLGGLADLIGSLFSALGLDGVAGFFKGIGDALANVGTWLKENLVDPVVNWVKDLFGIHSPSRVFSEIGIFLMQGLFDGISSLVDKVIGVFTKIKDKIVGVWNTVKTKTTEIWNGIKNAIKTPINSVIGFLNGMISGVVDGFNGMIGALNKLSFDVPDWVPLIGGKTFGFNIGNISAPQIPYLAKGAVLKGGEPFLAVVNDQKRGQTNIEAPLKTIQEAVRIELDKFSTNFKMAMPDTSMYNYRPMTAPEIGYAGAYGNYQHDMSAYMQGGYNVGGSGILGMSEERAYNMIYQAMKTAIHNEQSRIGEKPIQLVVNLDGDEVFNKVYDINQRNSSHYGRSFVVEEYKAYHEPAPWIAARKS